jgi:hypothetical protein
MRTKEGWRQHLRDLMGASLDPTIYAVQWADDPRCLQRGGSHRRVGAFASLRPPVCRLWAASRKWI